MRPLFPGANMGSPQRMRFKGKPVGLWAHRSPRRGERLYYYGVEKRHVPAPYPALGLGTRDHLKKARLVAGG